VNCNFLPDRFATIMLFVRPSVYTLSVCLSRTLYMVPLSVGAGGCTSVFLQQGTSYSLLQTFLLHRLATKH